MCCIMLLQNVSFCCSWIIFSGVNSGRDINFCSKCGISSGDILSRDSLDSSVYVTGKVFLCIIILCQVFYIGFNKKFLNFYGGMG